MRAGADVGAGCIGRFVVDVRAGVRCRVKALLGILDSLQDGPAIVPALWQTEVVNGLRVGERRKLVDPAHTAEYLARLRQRPIVDTVSPISRRDSVIDIGRRYGLSAYDAGYLELAIHVGGPLATFDRGLAKAAKLQAST